MRTRVVCGVNNGDPPLTLTWLKDGRQVTLAGLPDIQVTEIDAFSSVLTIDSLRPGHAGVYTCSAINAAAQVLSVATLRVNGKAVLISRKWSTASGHRRPSALTIRRTECHLNLSEI